MGIHGDYAGVDVDYRDSHDTTCGYTGNFENNYSFGFRIREISPK